MEEETKRALVYRDLWIRDVTITNGLVDTSSTPRLLTLVTEPHLDPGRFVTRHFTMETSSRRTTSSPGRATPGR